MRDGVGTDISTTSSTTQLSANWDASADGESGISGYQYAIGTSAGGTQTVDWTSLGNVTTVTKSLTLTVGQTYFFSVKAVNGAGLTGSATNSNGQTVVSSATTYFSDNFENWTVHGGAWSSISGESSSHTLNTSTDYAAAGTKSLKLTDTDSTGGNGACLVENFSPTISGDIYVRFYLYLPTGYTSANAGSGVSRRLLHVYCASNRGQISLTNGAYPLMEEVGAWGGVQAASALSENAWHCIEMHISPPSASTPMQFWIDGTSTGTLNGSFSGSSTFTRITLGDISQNTSPNGNGTFYMDELVASNYYNGPLTRCAALRLVGHRYQRFHARRFGILPKRRVHGHGWRQRLPDGRDLRPVLLRLRARQRPRDDHRRSNRDKPNRGKRLDHVPQRHHRRRRVRRDGFGE